MKIIVSAPTDTQDDGTPFDRTAAMSRADGCPECVYNYEPPRDVAPGEDGFYAGYLCTDCGHAWMTTWSAA